MAKAKKNKSHSGESKNSFIKELRAMQRQEEKLLWEQHPSKVKFSPWVEASIENTNFPAYTENSGKWCVFVNKEEHDVWWVKIRQALLESKLGRHIKTSTAFESPLAPTPTKAVIIIYTYNYEDVNDVKRIRKELFDLGVTWKIAYKTDKATLEGKYSNRGDSRISLYYE